MNKGTPEADSIHVKIDFSSSNMTFKLKYNRSLKKLFQQLKTLEMEFFSNNIKERSSGQSYFHSQEKTRTVCTVSGAHSIS